MKRLFKILLTIVVLSLNLLVCINLKADNGSSNETYTTTASGNFIQTQDAYIAVKTVTSITLDNATNFNLNNAEDIYYNEVLEKFYIADTGNSRILMCSKDLSNGTEIGKGILSKPQGVFTSDDGFIYVADYGLKAVVIFDPNDYNNPGFIYKPTHPLYVESSSDFLPCKIAVDAVGTMYIIDSGNANGIVTITKDGEFSGYFGANYVKPDFAYVIKFLLSTKEQKKKLYVSPISPSNLAIDDDGLINTISNIKGSVVKKLNIAGTNLFPTNMIDWTDYTDICIGPTGTIYCVEAYGYIVEYDREGNLLFDMGGQDPTGTFVGLFRSPTSIEVDDDHSLYVLDGNNLQVFVQTEFCALVHEALELYNDGKYEESRRPWEEVLKLNNMFDLAHRGLGNAYLRLGDYKKALEEFKLAKDTTNYSNAYWQLRNEWLNSYGYISFIIIISIVVILIVLNKLHVFDKLKGGFKTFKEKVLSIKFFREFFYMFKFIRHPLNGFYEVRHCNAMGVGVATIWYGWFLLMTVIGAFATGFVFNSGDKETYSFVTSMIQSVLPLLLFVIANYLISSITTGSGRLRDVYVASICSFAPVLIFMPFVILLSNFIIESEGFFFTLPRFVLYGWSFVLLFFMIKDIEELSIGENIKNILLTILTMLLFVAFGFLLYILGKQFVDFISDVIREVFSRG